MCVFCFVLFFLLGSRALVGIQTMNPLWEMIPTSPPSHLGLLVILVFNPRNPRGASRLAFRTEMHLRWLGQPRLVTPIESSHTADPVDQELISPFAQLSVIRLSAQQLQSKRLSLETADRITTWIQTAIVKERIQLQPIQREGFLAVQTTVRGQGQFQIILFMIICPTFAAAAHCKPIRSPKQPFAAACARVCVCFFL